ncbi:anti-sigma factor [Flexivirga lutea]
MSPLDETGHVDHAAERADAIIDVACGQPIEAVDAERIRDCAECVEDVRRHRRTIDVLRSAPVDSADPELPPDLWGRIAADLQLREATPQPLAPPDRIRDRRSAGPFSHPAGTARLGRRRAVAAAVAVVVAGGAGVIGYLVGASHSPTTGTQQANADLRRQPGAPAAASGTATVRASKDGRAVDVRTSRLPATSGYYEVWLFDPQANTMVAIGTLGAGHDGSFPVPAGLDLGKFHVVDVSAQKLNGDNTHQRSVLRGSLS